MSQTIDERVVEMRFDNSDFEQNVKTSMSTLDRLKAALNFKGVLHSMDGITEASKKIDFSSTEVGATKAGFHITDVFEKVTRFLENDIARRIVNVGENMFKQLTFQPIGQGFDEFQLKMGSIQTIMAGTGESLETVNKYLDDLNHYADKTIYSFSDMTQNIGKFTNAGVKLDSAVKAIQGVANVAAVSGANANEASRAMYNFAQALSAGYVKLIDWKSIENANMATVEFKDQLLQTAVALKTVEKNADGTYTVLTKSGQGSAMKDVISATKNFNDSLQYQWMTTEVLTQTLQNYSIDVREMSKVEQEEYRSKLLAIGYTKEQADAIFELSKKAADAATEVKTFRQAMDTLKESIGSGWAQTWEAIVGDFEQGKNFWTDFEKSMEGIFASGSTTRNAILDMWNDLGGRDELARGLLKILDNLNTRLNNIKEAWSNVFGKTIGRSARDLVKISKVFTSLINALTLSKEGSEALVKVLSKVFSVLKPVGEAAKIAGEAFVILAIFIQQLIENALIFVAQFDNMGQVLERIFGSDRYSRLASAWSTITENVSKSVENLRTQFSELGEAINRTIFGDKEDGFTKFLKRITSNAKEGLLNSIVSIFERLANVKLDIPTNLLTNAWSKLVDIFGKAKEKVDGAIDSIKTFFSSISTGFSNSIESVKNFSLTPIIEKIFGSEKTLQIVETWTKVKDKIKGIFDEIKASFDEFGTVNVKNFSNAVSSIGSIISGLAKTAGDNVVGSITKMFDKLKNIDLSAPAKLLTKLWDGVIERFKQVQKLASSAMVPLKGFFDMVGSGFKGLAASIKNFDLGGVETELIELDSSFKDLKAEVTRGGDIDDGNTFLSKMKNFFIKLGDVLKSVASQISVSQILAAGLVVSVISLISKISKLTKSVSGFVSSLTIDNKADAGTSIINSISLAFISLAGSLLLLSQIESDKLEKVTGAVLKLVLAFGGIVAVQEVINAFSKATTATWQFSVQMVSISGAILMMVDAFTKVQDLKWSEIKSSVLTFGVIVGIFVAAIALLSKFTSKITVSSLAILTFAYSIERMMNTFLAAKGMEAFQKVVDVLSQTVHRVIDFFDEVITKKRSVEEGGKAVLAVFTVLGSVALMNAISKGAASAKNLGIGLAAISAAIFLFTKVIKDLETISSNSIAKGVAAIDGLAVIVVGMLAVLGLITGESTTSGSLTRGIGGAGSSISKTSKGVKAGAASVAILAMTASIMLLSTLIKKLAAFSKAELAQAETALAGLALIVSLMTASTWFTGNAKSLPIIISLGALIACFAMMKEFATLTEGELEKCQRAIDEFGKIVSRLALLNLSTIATSIAKPSVVAIVTGSIIAIFGGLYLISQQGDLDALDRTVNLMTKVAHSAGLMMLEMSVLAGLLGKFVGLKNSLKGVAIVDIFVVDLIALIGGIGLLTKNQEVVDCVNNGVHILEGIHPVIDEIGIIATIAGGLSFVLQKIPTGSGVKAAGTLSAFIISLTAVVAAIGKIASLQTDHGDFITVSTVEKAGDILTAVSEAVSGFITGFITGAAKTMAASLPEIADSLSSFGDKIGGFVSAMANLPEGFKTKVFDLTASISDVYRASKEASKFISKGGSFEDFGSVLVDFGKKMMDYSSAITGFDSEAATASVNAGTAITGLLNNLPKEEGVWQKLFGGKQSLTEFAASLIPFGTNMKEFARVVSGLDQNIVTNAVSCATVISEFSKSLPNEGGWLAAIVGDNTLGKFASYLPMFGADMKEFGRVTSGFDGSGVDPVMDAASKVNAFANTIQNEGGALADLVGDNTLGLFAAGLVPFAQGMVDFGKWSKDFSPAMAEATTTILGSAVEINNFARTIQNQGGFAALLMGDNTLDRLADDLVPFAQGMVDFGKTAKEFDATSVSPIIYGTQRIGEIIPEVTKWIGFNYEDFLVAIQDIATEFQNFCVITEGVSSEEVTETANSITGITAVIQNMAGVDWNQASLFSEAISKLAEEGVSGFIIAFDDGSSRAATAINEFIGAIDLALAGLSYDKYHKIGENVAKGLAAGIAENMDSPVRAASQMAKNVETAVRTPLKVNSPSKVMIEIGEWVGKSLGMGIEENADDPVTSAGKMAKGIENVIRDTLQIHSYSPLIGDGIAKWIPESMRDGMMQKIDSVFGAAKSISNSVLSGLEEVVPGVSQMFGEIDEAASKSAESIEESGEVITGAGNSIKSTGKVVEEAVENFVGSTIAVKAFNEEFELGTKIVDYFYNAHRKLLDDMSATGNGYHIATQMVADYAKKLYEAKGATDVLTDTSKTASDRITEYMKGIQGAITEMYDSLKSKVTGIDLFAEIQEDEEAISKYDILANSQQQLSNMEAWAGELDELASRGINEGILQKLIDLGPEARDYTNAFLQMTEQELSTMNERYEKQMSMSDEVALKITNSMITTGLYAGEGYVQGLTEEGSRIASAAENMGTITKDNLERSLEINSPSKVTERIGNYTGLGLIEGIKHMETSLIAVSNEVAGKIKLTFSQGLQRVNFFNIGANLGEGLASGIRSKISEVAAAAEALANAANTRFRDIEEISSPSKVWTEFGEFMGGALSIGLDKSTTGVIGSVTDLADASIDSMRDALYKVRDVIEDPTLNHPVIRPVLDLTNIREGVDEVASMFGREERIKAKAKNQNGSINGENGESGNGSTYNFTQNNYSPKSLSRLDIYRQTRNQFAMLKGVGV